MMDPLLNRNLPGEIHGYPQRNLQRTNSASLIRLGRSGGRTIERNLLFAKRKSRGMVGKM